MDQSRGCGVARTSAAAAVVVEQEIVRVSESAAVIRETERRTTIKHVLWSQILRGSLRRSLYLKDFNAKKIVVRERGITHCVLLMSLGVTNWPLLFEIVLDYITICCFEVL